MPELLKGFPKKYEDPETGCVTTDETALQICRQTYFLNQQRLEQQTDQNLQKENAELKTQVEEIRNELDVLKSQPTTTATMKINEYGNVTVFSLILITAILVTVIITKHMSKK